MREHSPTPWQTDPNDECLVLDANGKSAADVRIDVCDAEFIVRAVNCHERLLMAYRAALMTLKSVPDGSVHVENSIFVLTNAIA